MPALATTKDLVRDKPAPSHGRSSLPKKAVRDVSRVLNSRFNSKGIAIGLSRRLRRRVGRVIRDKKSAIVSGKRKRNTMGQNAIAIHEDGRSDVREQLKQRNTEVNTRMLSDDEEEAQYSDDVTDSDEEVDESVAEDMRKLEENFKGISQKYRLINKIGEGTFSTVYKAVQLPQDDSEDTENDDPDRGAHTDVLSAKRRRTTPTPQSNQQQQQQRPKVVALKKIYVTSSPHRILNELELLHELRDSPYICPLLMAMRHLDQVVAVLPYFRHLDFRYYYRDFLVNDMRHYFRSLFSALHHVHKAGILHRDIKPTNFLYDYGSRHGVLVDFGLAEREGTDWQACHCQERHEGTRRLRFMNSYAVQNMQQSSTNKTQGYPSTKHDQRPSRRANRAGTRGFRAPEVLFKCTAQTTKIDMWSAGVILLTLLARRFPFFNSADDVDAMIEIASIFGKRRMQSVAALHGSVFETNIETIGDKGFTFEKIVVWASCRERESDEVRAGESQAIELLERLLELDPHKRLTAKEALQDSFFVEPVEDEAEREEREMMEMAEEEQKQQIRQRMRG